MKFFKFTNPFVLIAFVTLTLTQCQQNQEQLQQLQTENQELKQRVEGQELEIIDLKTAGDDYVSEINKLQGKVTAYEGQLASTNTRLATTRFDAKYAQLIDKVHEGWEELAGGGSRDKLMSNFTEGYSVNGVRFTGEASASVGQGMNNFEQYLDELEKLEDLKASFGQVEILFADQVGNNYSVAYTTTIRVFRGGQETDQRKIICVISGTEGDGLKIGNYSWVSLPQPS